MPNDVNNIAKAAPSAFYEDLESLLIEEMRKQPAKLDVRVKLAELYSQTRRVNDFIQHAQLTHALIKDPKKSDEWRRIASMGRALKSDEPLFTGAHDDVIQFDVPKSGSEIPASHNRIGDEPRFKKPLQDLADAYEDIRKDSRFLAEIDIELMQSAGYASPLEPARRLSEHIGGAQIYLKRNDIGVRQTHIASAIVGQALLAKRMGKKTLVTASGNGHSGVLLASVAARLDMNVVVFMSVEQMQIQRTNIFRMWLCGADVQEVDPKGRSGGDIRKAAFDHWARSASETFLVMGLDAGPHPYPMMMMEFTSLVGRECRRQMFAHTKKAPDIIVARAGENADAIGLFPPFLKAPATRLVCVGAVDSFEKEEEDAATAKNQSIQQRLQPLSSSEQHRATKILEGLDYPSVAREQAWLKATGRIEYVKTQSAAAKKAISDLSRLEGIIPAIETSYALAWACQTAATMSRSQSVLVFLGEHVEKNIWDIGKAMGVPL